MSRKNKIKYYHDVLMRKNKNGSLADEAKVLQVLAFSAMFRIVKGIAMSKLGKQELAKLEVRGWSSTGIGAYSHNGNPFQMRHLKTNKVHNDGDDMQKLYGRIIQGVEANDYKK